MDQLPIHAKLVPSVWLAKQRALPISAIISPASKKDMGWVRMQPNFPFFFNLTQASLTFCLLKATWLKDFT